MKSKYQKGRRSTMGATARPVNQTGTLLSASLPDQNDTMLCLLPTSLNIEQIDS